MKIKLSMLLLLLVIHAAIAQPDLKKLDAYYAKAQKEWNVPGMSVAIVKDGKIVFSKGYGVKEIGKAEVPDENTLYAIASNTKAFTATIIGQLVDEGKFSWDDKVKKYLPYFELYDRYVSEETTIRDLLSHRVGLGTFSGDLLWYRSTLTPEEIIKKVKYLPRDYDFRSGFGYSNVMYITAGELIKTVTGKTWHENIQERIIRPLGMSRTITSIKDLDKIKNYATPHAIVNNENKLLPWEDWETAAATGGIISSVKDLANWMILNLNHGVINGDTLISTASHNMIWTPHNTFNVNHNQKNIFSHFYTYGLGWNIADYRGRFRVGHTGGYSGMLSAIALMPDEKLGIVILTNGMHSVYSALINYTIDAYLKQPVRDWSSERLALELEDRKNDTRIEDRKKLQVANTKPTLPLDKYVGTYLSKNYGKLTVGRQGEKLTVAFEHSPDLSATLEHWHYDVWELKWNEPALLAWFSFGTIKFNLDNNLSISGVEFDVPNDDLHFTEFNAIRVVDK